MHHETLWSQLMPEKTANEEPVNPAEWNRRILGQLGVVDQVEAPLWD